MSIETTALKRWIIALLKADEPLAALVGGRIYSTSLPQKGGAYPAVLIVTQSAVDQNSSYGFRTGSRILLQVKAITQENDIGNADLIAARIEAVLQGQKATLTDFRIQSCLREQEIDYPEYSSGERYNHLGGLYAIQLNLF